MVCASSPDIDQHAATHTGAETMKTCKTASRYDVTTCAICPARADCATFADRPRGDALRDRLAILSATGQGGSDFALALRSMKRDG